MALKNDSTYFRVANPTLAGKYHILFNLEHCIENKSTGEYIPFKTETFECEYLLDGGNVYEQCYKFISKSCDYGELFDC